MRIWMIGIGMITLATGCYVSRAALTDVWEHRGEVTYTASGGNEERIDLGQIESCAEPEEPQLCLQSKNFFLEIDEQGEAVGYAVVKSENVMIADDCSLTIQKLDVTSDLRPHHIGGTCTTVDGGSLEFALRIEHAEAL